MAGRWIRGAGSALAAGVLLLPVPLAAQRGNAQIEGRVWLDRGGEPTLQRGETARLYYRASRDAFVAIFQIDTNGSARMIFPRSPEESNLARAGLDYRLLFERSSFWQVDEDPGVGYFFLIASPNPLDFSSFRYSHVDRGWDVSPVAREVYRDPYVAMDEYVAALVPRWQAVPYALDFVTYHVGGRFEFPRFLCYSCHGFRPFEAWNPYVSECADVRMLIYDDRYYYAATRYRADRVVLARPSRPFEPRFAFKDRTAGEPGTPLLLPAQRRAAVGAPSGTPPSGVRSNGSAGAQRPVPADVSGRRTGRGADERTRPVLQPRPAPGPATPPPPSGAPRPQPDGAR